MINSPLVQIESIAGMLYRQVAMCHIRKIQAIQGALCEGVCFSQLGGVRVKRRPNLVRFKIGRDYRLIFKQSDAGLTPYKLVTRQAFERELVRRR